ncbi:Non-specific serine/threonine protein kinase protein [Dioscorea alata]|uniref:Non-specific serine/threonine protein kinase protein n=1 Tax=Dioscorea alata TaxID=55571 RepID=A0ACB7V6N5_DIOAL|nr:Non-specific serine/threonine protein kinase protein [Dioscorea alata]
MGCCPSAPNSGDEDASGTNINYPHPSAEGTTPFRQYSLAEIMAATDGFSWDNIIAKGGGTIPNYVFRGRLPETQQIAVKRFSKNAWPDVEQFRKEAIRAGRLRHRRLVNLIGYCCDKDERLLVAEFMPNDSLDYRLFNAKNKTMEWSMRLRVACYIAEALEYCSNIEGQALYHDLSPYKILFDEADNPCLSCFGLVKNHRNGRYYCSPYMPPECRSGMITPKSMIFGLGYMIRDLVSGRQIPQDHEMLEMVVGKQIPIRPDSRLKGEYSAEDATALLELASQCMRHKPNDRPTIKDVIATLAQVQSNAAGPSNAGDSEGT